MTIREMHYDLDFKLQSTDSDKYRNFKNPEKDWVLNEAARIWVKTIAFPRYASPVNFEINTRTIHDLYKIVINQKDFDSKVESFDDKTYIYNVDSLDPEFWFMLSGEVQMKQDDCQRVARLYSEQHDDLFEESLFSKSSFTWGEVNYRTFSEGLRLFAEDFEILGIKINYIKRLKYMYNALDYQGSYKLLGTDTVVTDSVDSEFSYSREICSEIVDIAVLLLTNNLVPDYNIKQSKLGFTDKRI